MAVPFTLALLVAALLGVGAGLITTVAGFGGGIVLALSLAPVLGPAAALVVAAPALAVGHIHRARVYREHIDARVARRFALGAAPGAVAGGLVAASVPESVLGVGLLAAAGLAVLQALGLIPSDLGRRAVIPGAAAVGFLAASCGGGGVMLPPTLMSAGLEGRRFVATAATGALVVQSVRIATYGALGLMELGQVPLMVAAGFGLIGGNALGRRHARGLDDARTARWTRATLALAITLGVVNALV
ncbi:hypothetical protein DB30_04277 [Enhygromyxa salina]|uniref:Probable membrane transporter protein n=1 Tax=Enhygromyxa salina TaxID=215803 RepID=A0A0C1ZZR4_9BACT|nr:TSUP family transporter [Enhygromyxa salina]KIG16658.1 hypothetical protein DB30_04277 [Enhygromyxa salina]